jgi:hypothetical protein
VLDNVLHCDFNLTRFCIVILCMKKLSFVQKSNVTCPGSQWVNRTLIFCFQIRSISSHRCFFMIQVSGRFSVLDLLPATKDFGFRPPFLSHCWDFGCPRSHSSIPTSHCPAWLLSIHLHFLLIKCLYLPLHDWSLPWTFIFYFFIYSYVHTLFGPFLPPSPCPLPLRSTLLTSRQNLFCPLLQFCWRENISNNKKGKAFLLVEIRIAVQRDS